jgi:hypothetical protein
MTSFADRPLEEQIAQWRTFVRHRHTLHGPDVEELEGHLRDQLVSLTETGLVGDEAFLVAVKRMGNLDALSREFAREHSERLWKQLVMSPTPDAADESPNTARAHTFVVLILAVAAALAVKIPDLFGLRLLRHRGSFADLERWQIAYLPAYATWAALVVIVFPLVFGFR